MPPVPVITPAARAGPQRQLRPDPPAQVLDRERLGVEVRGPQPALLRQLEVAQAVADVRLPFPRRSGIALGEVRRRGVPKLAWIIGQMRRDPELVTTSY